MSAIKYDFTIEQGASFRFVLIYKDSDYNVVNLTGWCARLVWKTNEGISTTFESGHDSNDYKFTIDGLDGKLTLLIPASTTNSYEFSSAKYDLELQSPADLYSGGGKYTKRIMFGTATLSKRFSSGTTALACN